VKKTASARLFAETLFGRLEADENGDVRVRDVMRELRRDRAAAATALGLPVEVARGGNKGGADGGRQALLMRVGDALKLGGEDGAALASSIDVLFEAYSDTDLRTISLDELRAWATSIRKKRHLRGGICSRGVDGIAPLGGMTAADLALARSDFERRCDDGFAGGAADGVNVVVGGDYDGIADYQGEQGVAGGVRGAGGGGGGGGAAGGADYHADLGAMRTI
jgi:hypothetical protein